MTADGTDTALARLLLATDRLPLETLREVLNAARWGRPGWIHGA